MHKYTPERVVGRQNIVDEICVFLIRERSCSKSLICDSNVYTSAVCAVRSSRPDPPDAKLTPVVALAWVSPLHID